ncbi:hypothetical protein GGF43_004846, partial [Coemansia sp. RSA 2618]
MAVIFVFDNVGNMLGPLLGGKAYEQWGVSGIAGIAISLGVFELCMLLIFVRNSLDIRRTLVSSQDIRDPQTLDKAGKSEITTSCSSTNTFSEESSVR